MPTFTKKGKIAPPTTAKESEKIATDLLISTFNEVSVEGSNPGSSPIFEAARNYAPHHLKKRGVAPEQWLLRPLYEYISLHRPGLAKTLKFQLPLDPPTPAGYDKDKDLKFILRLAHRLTVDLEGDNILDTSKGVYVGVKTKLQPLLRPPSHSPSVGERRGRPLSNHSKRAVLQLLQATLLATSAAKLEKRTPHAEKRKGKSE
jgi:hypothetical protein